MNKVIVSAILLLAIFSCEKSNDNNALIESEIYFYPFEIYSGYDVVEKPALKLYVATESYIGGGTIHYTSSVENNELKIKFTGVEDSQGFLEPAPAVAYIDLPDNVDEITFINGSLVDKYKVSISETEVEIDSIISNYTVLYYNKIFRYPENTFNFTCWTNSSDPSLCTDCLTILSNELLLVRYEFIGDSKIPYSYYASTSPEHYTAILKYEKESDFDRAGELLEEFTLARIPPDEGISISLIGWNNKQFHSYIFNQ